VTWPVLFNFIHDKIDEASVFLDVVVGHFGEEHGRMGFHPRENISRQDEDLFNILKI